MIVRCTMRFFKIVSGESLPQYTPAIHGYEKRYAN